MQCEQPDWNLIRELYNKGLALRQIAEQFGLQVGTVASRASRGNWRATATRAKQIAQSVQKGVESEDKGDEEPNKLSKASSLVRSKLSDELLRAVDTLTSTKPSKRLESQMRRASVMQTLAGAAKPVYGWSEGQSQPAVRIAIMGATVQVQQETEAKAIDIASEPVKEGHTDAS